MALLAPLKVDNLCMDPDKHWAEGSHFFNWCSQSWEMVSGHKL